MQFYIVMYSSVTHANKIKNEVQKIDLSLGYISVIRTPKVISKGGCNYSLRFKNSTKIDLIKQVSDKFKIKILGIYKEIPKETMKEYKKID